MYTRAAEPWTEKTDKATAFFYAARDMADNETRQLCSMFLETLGFSIGRAILMLGVRRLAPERNQMP